MNVHTPERQIDESQADYRIRQKASKRAAQLMTLAHDHKQHSQPSSRRSLRDEQRKNGKLRSTFAEGVQNAAAKKRAAANSDKLRRDDHGSFTRVGRDYVLDEGGNVIVALRRVWLAGISAQRGY